LDLTVVLVMIIIRTQRQSLYNETEAETVRLIYDMYLQGNGCGTIAKRLVELGIKNKFGTVEWHDHGVMGMIKNEKYKGDVLLGKTSTVMCLLIVCRA
jgi:site-specific DNA recombinase